MFTHVRDTAACVHPVVRPTLFTTVPTTTLFDFPATVRLPVTVKLPLLGPDVVAIAYEEPRARSATGPILGAIVGGALGNAVGHKKRNKQVGTVVGAVLGGSIGADIARRHRGYGENVRYSSREVCSVVHEERHEERLAGYRVTYRYGGETYTTEMDHDPGDSLRVQVRVTPVG